MSIHLSWRGFLAIPLSLLMPGTPGSAAPQPAVSRDINALSRLITLPRRPLHALWQAQTIGDGNLGPSDTRLIAVLVFSPHDMARLGKSTRLSPARLGFVDVQPWFPSSIRQKAIRQSAGKFTRNLRLQAPEMDARGFYKLSLSNGSLFRIPGTNTCVLSLFTT